MEEVAGHGSRSLGSPDSTNVTRRRSGCRVMIQKVEIIWQ